MNDPSDLTTPTVIIFSHKRAYIHIHYFFEKKEDLTVPTVIIFSHKRAYIHILHIFEKKGDLTTPTVIKRSQIVCVFYNSGCSTNCSVFTGLRNLYVRCLPSFEPSYGETTASPQPASYSHYSSS